MLKVDLIGSPENTLKLIVTSGRICSSGKEPIEIWRNPEEEKMLTIARTVINSGHHSVLEHCHYVFAISGVSRACTHQLVRHRHMSFSQKSQRYVTEKEQFEYVTPERINPDKEYRLINQYTDEEVQLTFNTLMFLIQDFYTELHKDGIPAEDARFVLPNAATSSMVASLNLRELIHLANLRLCTKAQWEIRTLVQAMCDLVIEGEPWLKEYLVPKCKKDGRCTESKPCNKENK